MKAIFILLAIGVMIFFWIQYRKQNRKSKASSENYKEKMQKRINDEVKVE